MKDIGYVLPDQEFIIHNFCEADFPHNTKIGSYAWYYKGMELLIGFILRFAVILGSHGVMNHDLSAWLDIGSLTLAGQSIFPEPAATKAPYFPLLLYLMSGSVWLQRYGIDPIIALKTVVALFDTWIIYLIYRITGNKKSALLYALNPISILIIGVQGQLDAIPLSILLLALYLKAYDVIAMVLSSLAVALKTWPLIFLIPLFKEVSRKRYLLLLPLIPAVVTLLYADYFQVSVRQILDPILHHRGLYGAYGTSLVFKSFTVSQLFEQRVVKYFPLLIMAFMLRRRSTDVYTHILYGMFFFFAFTPTFGIQWLIWLMPFLVITRHSHRFWYMLAGSVYLMGAYLQWGYQGFTLATYEAFLILMGFIMWIVMLYIWAYGETRHRL